MGFLIVIHDATPFFIDTLATKISDFFSIILMGVVDGVLRVHRWTV